MPSWLRVGTMRIKRAPLLIIGPWESAEMEKTKSEVTFSGETGALSSHSSVADLPQSEEARMSAELDHSQPQTKFETIELGSFQLIDELNCAVRRIQAQTARFTSGAARGGSHRCGR